MLLRDFPQLMILKIVTVEALIKIEGIEEDTAKELIDRAKEFYQKDQEEISKKKSKILVLKVNLIEHVV